jgi:hypothetical protein
MIFVGAFTYGQVYTVQSFSKSIHKSLNYSYLPMVKSQTTVSDNRAFTLPLTTCSLIKADYYVKNFGFFCKKELQLEKATRLPLRFRLGSLQQCDWLEGKPNSSVR